MSENPKYTVWGVHGIYIDEGKQVPLPDPVYVLKTEARANSIAKRFGLVVKHENVELWTAIRYGMHKVFFSEDAALEWATDPSQSSDIEVRQATPAELHEEAIQLERDMRAEMAFERRYS
jgi:hypothetical protein